MCRYDHSSFHEWLTRGRHWRASFGAVHFAQTSRRIITMHGRIHNGDRAPTELCAGGKICPLTATELKNPVTLRPLPKLRREIWEYRERLDNAGPAESLAAQPVSALPTQSHTARATPAAGLPGKASQLTKRVVELREQEVQQHLAADRIPATSPATSSLYHSLRVVLAW